MTNFVQDKVGIEMDMRKTKPADLSPPSEKGRKRRESILDVAEDILVEDGYGAFSSRGIADRLGIRLSNVQYYFPTRESILAAVFERSLNTAAAALTDSVHNSGLVPLVRFILADQQSSRSCRMFWELWALAARDEAAAEIKTHYYLAYQKALETAIAVDAPNSSAQQRKQRALLIMSLLEGVSLFRNTDRCLPDTGSRFDDTLMETILALARGHTEA